MKKCLEIIKRKTKIEKDFKDFADDCFCLNTFNKKEAEFRRIKTKIQLGINEMGKNCTLNENKCPSEFCAKLYDEIMKEVPKKE
jgi:hypothetical protein